MFALCFLIGFGQSRADVSVLKLNGISYLFICCFWFNFVFVLWVVKYGSALHFHLTWHSTLTTTQPLTTFFIIFLANLLMLTLLWVVAG